MTRRAVQKPMVPLCLGHRAEREAPIARVFVHKVHTLQCLQNAVNRHSVHRMALLCDPLLNIVGRTRRAQTTQRIDDQSSRLSIFQTMFFEQC